MVKALLLSAAYSWFFGLLVMMAVMAILFVFIAYIALKPINTDDAEENSSERLLKQREAELTQELLSGTADEQHKEEIMQQLREVAAAGKVVQQLKDEENGKEADEEDDLSEEEAAELEKQGDLPIEQSFGGAPVAEDGVKKSFTAKLIQSNDNVKVWYYEVKNCLMCYEKVRVRTNWSNEKFYIGRKNVAALTIRGKTLVLYVALNPAEYSATFKVKNATTQAYSKTPCMFRLKSAQSVKKAKQLIALLMADYGVMYVKSEHSEFALPYEDDDALVAKGLIKPVKRNVQKDVQTDNEDNK